MKKEKISECIGQINDKYLYEAADFSADADLDMKIPQNAVTKKARATAVIIFAAAVAITISVAAVIATTAHRNNSGPPTYEEKIASDYVDDYIPTEKDKVRSEYRTELNNKLDKLHQENGLSYGEASEQVLLERISEIADILKKYNKVDSGFVFRGIDDNVTGIRAACELLNSSESLTVRETVVLEDYLEDGYFTLRELGGHDDLMDCIKDTVHVRYIDD